MRPLIEIARFVYDVPEAARFYRELFQREPVEEHSGLVIFDLGGISFLIHERYEPGPDDRDPEDHIAVGVTALGEAVEAMKSQGYDVEPATMYEWGRSAYLRDPDGHLVELHERPHSG
jgi:catechol 2,3-dioxygenase-like lactoylglutathione lyase family enzyme